MKGKQKTRKKNGPTTLTRYRQTEADCTEHCATNHTLLFYKQPQSQFLVFFGWLNGSTTRLATRNPGDDNTIRRNQATTIIPINTQVEPRPRRIPARTTPGHTRVKCFFCFCLRAHNHVSRHTSTQVGPSHRKHR